MELLKCIKCREFITHAKEHLRSHEARYHSYGSVEYIPHVPRHRIGCQCMSCKEDLDKTVARGEKRIGLQHFYSPLPLVPVQAVPVQVESVQVESVHVEDRQYMKGIDVKLDAFIARQKNNFS